LLSGYLIASPPSTMESSETAPEQQQPSPPLANYIAGFLLVGIAWGLTTPFIRRAATRRAPRTHPVLESEAVRRSAVRRRVYGAWFAVVDLLGNPGYAIPLAVNLTGSVWFFLLIGKAGEFFFF
jgi:hypothetical protein